MRRGQKVLSKNTKALLFRKNGQKQIKSNHDIVAIQPIENINCISALRDLVKC